MVFNSLQTRLVLTYAVIIALVLCIVGISIFSFLLRNPYETRVEFQRLNFIANSIVQRKEITASIPPSRLQELVERADNVFKARIVVQDRQGRTLVDSRKEAVEILPDLNSSTQKNKKDSFLSYKDSRGRTWLYSFRSLSKGYYLIVTVPRPRPPVLAILRDEFFTPFIRAIAVALLIAVVLSFWMARWVSKPLQRIGKAANQVVYGEFRSISPQGPQEVADLAKAFNSMATKVHASQISQREFVSNVSHELKTPITSIKGFAQAMMDGTIDTPEEHKKAARVIFSESERMQKLVQNLLDLARFDAGTAALERLPVDFAGLLDDIVGKFSLLADKKQVKVVTEFDKLPIIIGDSDRLEQVFTNIIDNAIKHTPSGERIIIQGTQKAGSVIIEVIDNGSGIPDEDLTRIFERFFQVDKSRGGRVGKGVGLGLPIAKEIVRSHGGTISVHNNPRQGSTFVVKLPLSRPDDSTLVRRNPDNGT